MKRPARPACGVITESFIHAIRDRLAEGKRVRRALPGKGRLHIDRQLPFLCLYRRPESKSDAGTDHLVLGQASYLIAYSDVQLEAGLSALVQEIIQTLAGTFDAFLLIEIWSAPEQKNISHKDAAHKAVGDNGAPPKPAPLFRIHTPMVMEPPTTVSVLADALREISLPGIAGEVEVLNGSIASPPHLPSLLTTTQAADLGCLMIGLEIAPCYRDAQSGAVFPALLRTLQRELSRALHKAFFEFMQVQTTHHPLHHQTLGRRATVRAVWETDRQLAAVSNAFDFLLSVSPTNTESAWNEFEARHFERLPEFRYRLLSVDPDLLKRDLYNIRIERIEDPTIAYLFRDKRSELDRQITMLDDRGSPRFLLGSLQLYGGVDDGLLHMAQQLLSTLAPDGGAANLDGNGAGEYLDAVQMGERAREEIEYYRQGYSAMTAQVQIRSDISGLMVSRGDLLIGQHSRIPAARVKALLQHEVGTHLLTYFNGRSQPLRQLYSGLAGYEELQEGLAVLAEYMVDGLSRSRLRLLAARVLAVHCLAENASFLEIFRELHRTHAFSARTAFNITARVCRGGGLTKDAIYLRGLVRLLKYLQSGGTWEPLFAGKIGADHIPIIQELQWREVLHEGPLQPRYMSEPQIPEKLRALREGVSVLELLNLKESY